MGLYWSVGPFSGKGIMNDQIGPALQLKHILVPTDFSEGSDKALRYAGKFAEQFGARVTLLHIIQPMVYPADFGYPPTMVDTMEDAVRQQVETRLADLAAASPFQ